ncbi:MAG: flagellar basal body rod protein FlgG [Candidatus Carbobacillus sp.]|nr:flagellar basal body rod protein FlgG [Candidatus Carbobacillus sp.]
MLRSLYTGISGMRGFQTKLDVVSNNIANVNTVGFKAGRAMFADVLSQTLSGVTTPEEGVRGGVNPKQVGLGSKIASIDTLFTQGSPMMTGVVSDLAIDGNGFFVIQDAAENKYLTRAGNFYVDAARQLVTADGLLVLDEGGAPIQLDEGMKSFSIAKDGTIIQVLNDGEINTDLRLGVARVANPGGLEKVGDTRYRLTPNADQETDPLALIGPAGEEGRGEIISGFLEMSNVDLTSEFTEMIVAQRGFQSNARIITTSDEVLQELVNLKR